MAPPAKAEITVDTIIFTIVPVIVVMYVVAYIIKAFVAVIKPPMTAPAIAPDEKVLILAQRPRIIASKAPNVTCPRINGKKSKSSFPREAPVAEPALELKKSVSNIP